MSTPVSPYPRPTVALRHRLWRPSGPRRRLALLAAVSVVTLSGLAGTTAPKAEAINNGSNVAPGSFPAVAYLANGTSCSGALIRPEWVLTAGHCVNALRPYVHQVWLGGSTTTTRRPYVVAGVRRHPSWPGTAGSDPSLDVALVRLATPVRDVIPYALAGPADAARLDGPADPVRAVGWGQTATNGPLATTLQTTTGTVSAGSGVLNGTFLRGGPCPGDSGSPLLVNVPGRGTVVAGELSKATCERGGGIYVDVASGPARNWVLSVLDSGVSEATEQPWTAGNAPRNRTCFGAGQRDAAAESLDLVPGIRAYRTSWWVYDPGPVARRVHVTTAGSAADTVLGVFVSTRDTLQHSLLSRVVSNDDSGGVNTSSVVFTTQANKPAERVYVIAVGTFGPTDTRQVCARLDDSAPTAPQGGADLAWYNSTSGQTQIWYMNRQRIAGRATVRDENGAAILIGPPWRIVGTADLDGDRNADIVWHHDTTHETQVWFMRLHQVRSRVTVVDQAGAAIHVGPPWRIVATRDMDGDGLADVVWYNTATSGTQIWFMAGARIRSRATVVDEVGTPILIGPPWRIVSAGDMNTDGKSDLVFHDDAQHVTQIWFMDHSRIIGRRNVVDEAGAGISIAPPWRVVDTGVFNPQP